MALTTLDKFLKLREQGELPKGDICVGKCGKEIHTAITGRQPTAKGDMCDDCYFDELSDVLEKSPIRTARIRRG